MTATSQKDPLQAPADWLVQAIDAPLSGRELAWTQNVNSALGCLENALRVHTAEMEGREGLFPSLASSDSDVMPTIIRRISRLRRDHYYLLLRVQKLRKAAEAWINDHLPLSEQGTWTVRLPALTPRGLRARCRLLIESIKRHHGAEIKLLLESTNQDTGVGD